MVHWTRGSDDFARWFSRRASVGPAKYCRDRRDDIYQLLNFSISEDWLQGRHSNSYTRNCNWQVPKEQHLDSVLLGHCSKPGIQLTQYSLHSAATPVPVLAKIVIFSCLSLNLGSVLILFSFIQFECCGFSGPIDWAYASYNGYQDITKEIGIGAAATALPFRIPSSCCRWGVHLIAGGQITSLGWWWSAN